MAWMAKILTMLLLAFGAPVWADTEEAEPVLIVAFGDSNTAGFGISDKNAYPAQLERALQAKGYKVNVVNGGASGNTSSRGLARMDRAIPEDADIAIVFFGRNDVRWGVEDQKLRANLDSIVRRLREQDTEVILSGFYTQDFSEIAAAHGAFYYPDFFDGVAVDGVKHPRYVLPWDPIGHLNAAGYAEIVSRLLPLVETAVIKVLCRRLPEHEPLPEACVDFAPAGAITGAITPR